MRRCVSCGTDFSDGWICPRCRHSPGTVDGFLCFAPDLVAGGENPPDFHALAELEAGNFWFRSRNLLITWAVRRYFPAATTFLEIGCGTGFVLSGLRQSQPDLALSGSEASCTGLSYARRRVPGATLLQMDARKIPFSSEFDVVGAFDVLEHVREDEQVLSEMYRAAKSGGGIVVTVPQHRFLWSGVDESAGHVRRYEASELVEKVSRAGFRLVRATSFVSLLLPIMIVSRLGRRQADGWKTATSEFALHPLLGSALEMVLNLEQILIRLGVSFPAGGSRLLIARKP